MNEHSNSRWALTAWVVLLLIQLGLFAFYLGRFKYLPGTDAYYYALQVQSLIDSGHTKVADGNAAPYIMAAISRLGLPIETSFRLVLIAIYGIYNSGLLLFIFRYCQKYFALAAVLFLLLSPASVFHTVEFPKLSLALALVPIWFCLLASQTRMRILWLILLMAASCLLHLALILPALIFVMTLVLPQRKVTRDASERLPTRRVIFVFIGIVLCIFSTANVLSQLTFRVGPLKGAEPGIFSLVETQDVPFDIKFAVIVIWLALVFCFLVTVSSFRRGRWFYLTVATLVIPFWPGHGGGLSGIGGRYALVFVFFAVPLILLLQTEMEHGRVSLSQLQVPQAKPIPWIVAALLLFVFPMRLDSYRGLLASQNYAAYESVVDTLRNVDVPMLVAHRGLDFFYSYRLKRDAFHFDPEPNWNRADIWRLAARITPEEVAYYSPPTCAWGETARTLPGTGYLLIREDCWERLRANVNQNENPDLYVEVWQDAENPSQPRPTYLRGRHHAEAKEAFPAYANGAK